MARQQVPRLLLRRVVYALQLLLRAVLIGRESIQDKKKSWTI